MSTVKHDESSSPHNFTNKCSSQSLTFNSPRIVSSLNCPQKECHINITLIQKLPVQQVTQLWQLSSTNIFQDTVYAFGSSFDSDLYDYHT